MAKSGTLKDNVTGEVIYPITLASNVYDANGNAITSVYATRDEVSKPVLLWQNGNPNAAFSGGTITLADSIWNYKTIRIAYKPMWCTYEQPIEYKDFESKNDYMNIYGLNVDTNENMITSRNIEIPNNTSVKFHASYEYSGSSRGVNNNRCIPIAIYGIK